MISLMLEVGSGRGLSTSLGFSLGRSAFSTGGVRGRLTVGRKKKKNMYPHSVVSIVSAYETVSSLLE